MAQLYHVLPIHLIQLYQPVDGAVEHENVQMGAMNWDVLPLAISFLMEQP